MRVLEVIPNWPPEVFIRRHIEAMQSLETEASFAYAAAAEVVQAGGSASLAPADRESLGVHVLPVLKGKTRRQKFRVLLSTLGPAGLLRLGPNVRKYLTLGFFRKFEFDLMHFHTALLAANYRWVCRALNKPYTVSLRGTDVQVNPLRSQASQGEIRQALEQAAGVHTVSEALGERYAPGNFTTIYSPLTPPGPGHGRPIREYGPGPYQFVAIGRLHWRKGYPDLLEAMRLLRDSGVDATLTIVGIGPDEERLAHKVADLGLSGHVTFTGKRQFPEITALLKGSHGYVQSSVAEGLSNALLEAMAYGCPVFATDVDGTNEVVIDRQTGFLLPALRPDLWPPILSCVRDGASMQAAAEKASRLIEERCDPQQHAEQFSAFFQESLSRASQPAVIAGQGPQAVRKQHLEENSLFVKNRNVARFRVAVLGLWEWPFQVDRLLRLMARKLDVRDGKLVIFGCGSLEDEIKYTLSIMDWAKIEVHVLEADQYASKHFREDLITQYKTLLELDEQANRWRYWENGIQKLEFGDSGTESMIRSIRQYYEQ